jgi:4-hydroxyacetophenone monooxygenase
VSDNPDDVEGFGPRLAAAMPKANIPVLLMLLVQLTGDKKWLHAPYAPSAPRGISDNDTGGLPEEVQAEVRAAASAAILAHRAGAPVAVAEPSEQMLVRMLSWSMHEEIPPEYGVMIAADFVAAGLRTPPAGVTASPIGMLPPKMATPPAGFKAIIIGAGIGGLTVAMAFERAGIAYTVLEKNHEVGGTWLVNRYPGAGVDTPNHLYSWAGVTHDWPEYFALRDSVQSYIEQVATDRGLRANIRFRNEVQSVVYDASRQHWDVTFRTADGSVEVLTANVVISAVGLFNTPKKPDIAGMDRFEGPMFHTAGWPEDIDLNGKRVAVIGSGASAMQVVPAIADRVRSLAIFQRSPQWAAPFERFQTLVADEMRFLLREVPLYQAWYRARLTWMFNDRMLPALRKDPDWEYPERSISLLNDKIRAIFTKYIKSELGDRQDLLEKSLPTYPPYGKRMLLDNGWWRTLTRDNVVLETDRVVSIDEQSVITASGTSYEVDCIVLATGFNAVRFLGTYELCGRSGRTVREVWDDDDAKAYLGTVIPDFPNFFCLYGPNLQTGHGGSYMTVAGSQVHYIMSVLSRMFEEGLAVVECKQEVSDVYNRRVDAEHEALVWTHPGMDTYYRNSRGRVSVNSPFRNVDFFQWTRSADLSDYVVEALRAHAAEPEARSVKV